MQKNEKNYTIDLVKYIMGIIVVTMHSFFLYDNQFLYEIYRTYITVTAVPFFMITSGFFIGRKYSDELSFDCYLINVIKKYIKLFLILGSYYALLSSVINFYETKSLSETIARLFISIIQLSPGGGMWYLASVAISFAIILLAKKIKISDFIILSFSLIPHLLRFLWADTLIAKQNYIHCIYEWCSSNIPGTIQSFIFFSCFVNIGYILGKMNSKSKIFKYSSLKYSILIIIDICLIYFGHLIKNDRDIYGVIGALIVSIATFMLSILIFLFAFQCKVHISDRIPFGKMSMWIYYCHFTVITITKIVFSLLKIDHHTTAFSILCVIICVILVYVWYYINPYIMNRRNSKKNNR